MLLRPAALRLGAVVVGPDQLVEEALPPEQLIKQELYVMGLAVVEVQVERARGVQDPPQFLQPRREEPEVVVEVVLVGGLGEQLGGVAAPAEAGRGRRRRRADGGEVAARLRAAGVERRVGVDHLRDPVRQLAQVGEVVALEDQRRPPVSAAAAPSAM